MIKKLIKTAIMYIILTFGAYMFMTAYSNSYNRLSTEKISPASINITADRAEMKILEDEYVIPLDSIRPESRLYWVLYILAPDEVKGVTLGSSFILRERALL